MYLLVKLKREIWIKLFSVRKLWAKWGMFWEDYQRKSCHNTWGPQISWELCALTVEWARHSASQPPSTRLSICMVMSLIMEMELHGCQWHLFQFFALINLALNNKKKIVCKGSHWNKNVNFMKRNIYLRGMNFPETNKNYFSKWLIIISAERCKRVLHP